MQKTFLNKLESKFTQCGTVVHNCTSKYLHLYNWPNITNLSEIFRLKFLLKVIQSPNDPLQQFLELKPVVPYTLRNRKILNIKYHKKCIVQQSFEYWAPRLINENESVFKSELNG